MSNALPRNISVYEKDFRLKLEGAKGILHPSEDLIRLVARGRIRAAGPDDRALDYGVGDGRHIAYLMGLGYSVIGTDVAPGSLEITRRDHAANERYTGLLLDDSRVLPLKDGEVALLVAWEVMHWLADPEAFLEAMAEFKRVLRPDGAMLLTMPTEQHYLKRYSLEVGKSTYRCTTPTRSDCVFYSPNLFTLKHLFETDLDLRVEQVLRYEYGSEQTEMTLEERMSFYGFCLRLGR